ncbi:hypothetical protein GGR51DRAFT_536273 [Nemania sp. FL0031]|nr:hypothetical protein GGR51DRAFT_536273 [Nemania sp. FL0031]
MLLAMSCSFFIQKTRCHEVLLAGSAPFAGCMPFVDLLQSVMEYCLERFASSLPRPRMPMVVAVQRSDFPITICTFDCQPGESSFGLRHQLISAVSTDRCPCVVEWNFHCSRLVKF